MTAAPAILDYATPGGPPPGCRFAVERHDDGVTLTAALPATPLLAAGLVLTTAMAAVGMVLIAASYLTHDGHGTDGPAALAGACVPAAIGVVSATHLPTTRPRTLSLVVRGGRFTMLNGPRRPWNRPLTVGWPRGFDTGVGQPDLLRLRVVDTLRVRGRFGLARPVLVGVPRAECAWLARELNAGLARGPRG